MEKVLFEVYDQAYECAYLERSIDSELAAVLGHQDSRADDTLGELVVRRLSRGSGIVTGGTDADYVKLMMIAVFFCRQRRLAMSICEPKELLNQAVLKTLECEEGKRWNKKVSIVRHLDRAMENISGHLVRERMKIVAFPDGLKPGTDDSKVYEPADEGPEAAKVSALLKAVFGDDNQATEVFVLRAEGFGPNETQARLGMSAKEYETVNRRILRKISQYVKQTIK